mmetsp:Transcript_11856/g.28445  ORF Transcript_11856/g.28445 Transcript_11856/m.28445 type:complete len:100 (+) Transcript_11856:969-1268(+)
MKWKLLLLLLLCCILSSRNIITNAQQQQQQQEEDEQQHNNIQALIYVSCGFDAFQRDYHRLVGSGIWELDHAEGHVLFPGSDAIETLACFRRLRRRRTS